MTTALDVYLGEALVGRLARNELAEMVFGYTRAWRERVDAVPLSHSLPLREEPFRQKEWVGYFAGLAPKGEWRSGAGDRPGGTESDFALLEALGGDCPGAVTFLSQGATPLQTKARYRVLADAELARLLRDRLSLAEGAEQLAVRLEAGNIGLPLAGAASSHILYPVLASDPDILHNRVLCLALAARVGLAAAGTIIGRVADISYLLVARGDRWLDGKGVLHRLQREDFCQALGKARQMTDGNPGGSTVKDCFDLLRSASSLPVLDLGALLDALIFHLIIGNHNVHAEQFALLYSAANGTRLAPLEDLVASVNRRQLDNELAIRIGGEAEAERVALANLESLAGAAGLAKPLVKRRVADFARRVLAAIDTIDKPAASSKRLATGVAERCKGVIARFERVAEPD
jgi:serine/threonine-protein kinase HipA